MKMILLHGRHDPDQRLDDWGFTGPVLRHVQYIHSVYGNLTIGFSSRSAAKAAHRLTGWPFFDDAVLEIRQHDDLIMLTAPEASYYGDWELVEDSDPVGG